MIGSTIGKYRVTSQLGRGGMGTVYRAVDETLDRDVAIKVLNADLITPEGMRRFRTEAVTVARLNHPRIASIYELAREGDGFVMVMEFVPGETCEKLLARTGPLPLDRAVVLCDQVLDALEYAHAAGIVHRDLKPANVMVTASGDIKVMDFGIARVAGSEHLTNDGYMVGTPDYMAPEQIRSEEVDRRMDLYAAAVMLYRLLTARMPFEADSLIALMHAQLSNPPTPAREHRADLPDWIEEILTRGLAKDRDQRFQSAAEFRLALESGLAGSLASASRVRAARLASASGLHATSAVVSTSGIHNGADNQETIALTPTPAALRTASEYLQPTPKTTPVPTVVAPKERTVTLRKPQLLAASGVLLGLAASVAVLAYLALHRVGSATTAPPSLTEAAAPVATPASAPDPSSTAAAAAPAASIVPPPSATPEAASAKPPTPTTPTQPAAPTPKPDQAAARTVAAATPPAAPKGSEPAPPSSAAAIAETQSFGDIKAVVADGTRTKEFDALLNLETDKAVLRSRDNGAVLQAVPYRSIGAAVYVHAKRPRGKEDGSLAQIPKDLGGSGFFLKTSKHWLTLQSAGSFVVLRLDDKNVITVLQSIESRTGSKIERIADSDK